MKRFLIAAAAIVAVFVYPAAFAQVKISDLPAAGALTGTEIVPIVQGGDTERTTTAAIAALAGGLTLASGTFTPVCTLGSGMSACTGTLGSYIRVGNQVIANFGFNGTGASATQSASVATPINTANTGSNVVGTCTSTGTSGSMGRVTSGGANAFTVNLNASQTTSIPWSCTVQYTVN